MTSGVSDGTVATKGSMDTGPPQGHHLLQLSKSRYWETWEHESIGESIFVVYNCVFFFRNTAMHTSFILLSTLTHSETGVLVIILNRTTEGNTVLAVKIHTVLKQPGWEAWLCQ